MSDAGATSTTRHVTPHLWDGKFVIVCESDVPLHADWSYVTLLDPAQPTRQWFLSRPVWLASKRTVWSRMYDHPVRSVPRDQLCDLTQVPFLLGYGATPTTPTHSGAGDAETTIDELHECVWTYMRLVCDALTKDPPCNEALFYETYKDFLESPKWRCVMHVILFRYVLGPSLPTTFVLEEGSENVRHPLLLEWLETERVIARSTLAHFLDTRRSLAFVSVCEPDVTLVSASAVRLTPLQALTWNRHNPTQVEITREYFLQSVWPDMCTEHVYRKHFLAPFQQWKHKIAYDARIQQVGLDLRKMIEPVLMGKTSALHHMTKMQASLRGSQQFANQEAVALHAKRCRQYESMRQKGEWVPPLDHAMRRQRLELLSHVPDMEDLFKPGNKALPACMRGVLQRGETDGHLKNDARQALAEWLVYSRLAEWDANRHMGRITGPFEGPNRRSVLMAIQYVIDNRGKNNRFSCQKIRAHTKSGPSDSALSCPYKDTSACAKSLGLPDPVTMTNPLDALLLACRI